MTNFSMTCLRKSKPLEVLEVRIIDYMGGYVIVEGWDDINFDDIMWLKQGKVEPTQVSMPIPPGL